MAAISSLNILLDPTGKDLLAERYGGIITNIEKGALSMMSKNKRLSGDPTTGTVTAKRFTNVSSVAYGTARTAGKGVARKDKVVTIALDQDKEIVTELESKDIMLLGVPGLVEMTAQDTEKAIIRELDVAYFAEGVSAGTDVTLTSTDVADRAEELILKLETVKNNYVDGVDRQDMFLYVSPQVYSKLRTYIDTDVNNANVSTAAESIDTYHGVKVFSASRLPTGTDMLIMIDGAIAQPFLPTKYDTEGINLSSAVAVEFFYSYGTELLVPDLCFNVATPTSGS